MYNEHFGLHDHPFSIAPNPRFLFMSARHREALAHLLYGIRNDGGFVLLTGEVGTGKTTVCRCLLEQLPANTRVAYITNPRLSALELLATICDEFGLPVPAESGSKPYIDSLNAFLLAAHAAGRQSVLIIDEAQNLSVDVLEQIRLLTNLETNRRKLLQIILLGQPELRQLLARPELRQLAQRITARYHLEALSRDEVGEYVRHRLIVAGARQPLFPPRLVPLIFRLSGGIPRRINILCDRALMGAYVLGRERVNGRVLKSAAAEIWPRRRFGLWPWAAGALVAAGLALFLSFRPLPRPVSQAVQQARPQAFPIPAAAVADQRVREIVPAGFEDAFRPVFSAWGIDYQPQVHGDPCRHAAAFGLACLDQSGDFNLLRRLNRPAILALPNGRGGKGYIALTGIADTLAQIEVEGKTVEVPIAGVEARWMGEFSLLWRRPPFDGAIRPGDRGAAVHWLARQFAALNGNSRFAGDVFQGELLATLKEFQRTQGIEADGVVGPATLILLDSKLGGSSPQIVRPQVAAHVLHP